MKSLLLSLFSTHRKANPQARCENFHPITIFGRTHCELANWLLQRMEKRLVPAVVIEGEVISDIQRILLISEHRQWTSSTVDDK